ncbi:hypothetical protein F5B19DRAFT_498330, partial [Rostrohypoxylon terebratum]
MSPKGGLIIGNSGNISFPDNGAMVTTQSIQVHSHSHTVIKHCLSTLFTTLRVTAKSYPRKTSVTYCNQVSAKMTKSIPSLSYELKLAKDTIQKLTERIVELREENGKLRSCLMKNKIAAPKSKHSRPQTRQTSLDKHYLTSTKASRNRDIQPSSQIAEEFDQPKSVVVGSKWYQYKDGILVDNNPQLDNWYGKPHYLSATFSSIGKRRPKAQCVWVDECGSDREYETSASPDSSRDSSRQDTSEEFAEESDDESDDGSSERGVFYDGSRKYFPKVHQQYPDGIHEVRFGWKEMQNAFFDIMRYRDKIIAGKYYSTQYLEAEIECITRIRNEVCHFRNFGNICTIGKLDGAIRDVQRFAAIFGDEARALQLRALRDELVEEAERGLAELESMWLLSELPGARPWERFHLHSFYSARPSDDGDDLSQHT